MHTPLPFAALESRTLLAGVQTFIDSDGDEVTVRLSGPGTLSVSLTGQTGPITGLGLTGTTPASRLSISVKQAGGGNGQVLLNEVNTTPGLVLGALDAKAANLQDCTLDLAAITRFIVRDISNSDLNLATPAGKSVSIIARDLIDANFQVTGEVSSLAVLTSDTSTDVVASGRIAKIVITDLAGEWSAATYGVVTISNLFTGELQNTAVDAKGVAFSSVFIGFGEGGFLGRPGGNGTGLINRLTISNWIDQDGGLQGRIFASGIGTLRVTGTLALEFIELSEAPAAFSIKSAFIQTLDTEIRLAARVGAVRIGTSLEGARFLGGTNTVDVRSLTFFDDGQVRGEYRMATLGSLRTGTGLNSQWIFTGQDSRGYSVRSMTLDALFGSISTPPGAGIRSLRTSRIDGATIDAGFIDSLRVQDRFSNQELTQTEIRLRGQNAKGFALTSALVGGTVTDSLITTDTGNVGSFTAGSFRNSQFYVARDPLATIFFDSQAGIGNAGVLSRFRLTDSVPADGSAFAPTSFVRAGTISSVIINGDIDDQNLAVQFGFGARVFGAFTMRTAQGATFKPVISPTPGDTIPLGVDSEFVIRVFA